MPATRQEWPKAALEIFGELPPEVREFYDVVVKWPTSKIVVDNNQDCLVFPPERRAVWNSIERKFEIPDPNLISLVVENQGVWSVWTSTSPSEKGKLFTDADPSFEPCDFPMKTSLEVFLVTFGLHELIMNGESCEVEDKFQEATLIFSGGYNADHKMDFHYHPEGYLWFSCYDSKPFWCAKRRRQ